MKQYLYTVEATRLAMLTQPNAEEKKVLPTHSAYVHSMLDNQIAIFVGAAQARDNQHFGIVIFEAEDDTAANAILQNDPAVKHRIMRGCLYPFRMSLWNTTALTLEKGQGHYFYKIRPVRPAMIADGATEIEAKTMGDHFMYLKGLTESGVFAFAGPTLVADNSNFGVGLLCADNLDAAWEIGSNDPAVIKRVMRLDIIPFEVAGYNPAFSS